MPRPQRQLERRIIARVIERTRIHLKMNSASRKRQEAHTIITVSENDSSEVNFLSRFS